MSNLVDTPALIVAAGAIIDVMMGGKFDWRSRLDHDDFLESADWQMAVLYASAAMRAGEQHSEIRSILAGADISSLPNDYSTVQMAVDRMADIETLRDKIASLALSSNK